VIGIPAAPSTGCSVKNPDTSLAGITEEDGADDVTIFPAPTFDQPVTYEYDIEYTALILGHIGKSYGRSLP